jgi:hypothetical protein
MKSTASFLAAMFSNSLAIFDPACYISSPEAYGNTTGAQVSDLAALERV